MESLYLTGIGLLWPLILGGNDVKYMHYAPHFVRKAAYRIFVVDEDTCLLFNNNNKLKRPTNSIWEMYFAVFTFDALQPTNNQDRTHAHLLIVSNVFSAVKGLANFTIP